MNSSISHAGVITHLKIVATALLASIAVVWIGIATHLSSAAKTPLPTATAKSSIVVAAGDSGRI